MGGASGCAELFASVRPGHRPGIAAGAQWRRPAFRVWRGVWSAAIGLMGFGLMDFSVKRPRIEAGHGGYGVRIIHGEVVHG
jgi:hypothetical protein